jgi:hypothetical protein
MYFSCTPCPTHPTYHHYNTHTKTLSTPPTHQIETLETLETLLPTRAVLLIWYFESTPKILPNYNPQSPQSPLPPPLHARLVLALVLALLIDTQTPTCVPCQSFPSTLSYPSTTLLSSSPPPPSRLHHLTVALTLLSLSPIDELHLARPLNPLETRPRGSGG